MARKDSKPLPEFTASDIARFWAKVDRRSEAECWLWTASLSNGYGHFGAQGRTIFSHRITYFLSHGVDPGNLFICHKCDQPLCNNPSHLFAGTAADNVNDSISKGRRRPRREPLQPREKGPRNMPPKNDVRGEKNGRAKLTEHDVVEIRALYASGSVSQYALGKKFGMTLANISRIIHRKLWKDVA